MLQVRQWSFHAGWKEAQKEPSKVTTKPKNRSGCHFQEEADMKSTGIVRKVDELGRVVLPIELRRNMGIEIKDSLEIFVDENMIILKKYEPADIFTGSMEDLIDFKGKKVSKASILEMARIAGMEVKE